MMAQAMCAATGCLPLVYGDASEFYAADPFLSQCPRWLAKYGPWAKSSECGPGWSSCQWQQFSGDGVNTRGFSVPGFAGITLDMSAFSGSVDEAKQTWAT
jgi:hypothetical protein